MPYQILEKPEAIRVSVLKGIGQYEIVADENAIQLEVGVKVYMLTTNDSGELMVVARNGSVRIKPGGGVNSFYIETVPDLLTVEDEELGEGHKYDFPTAE